MAKEWAKSFYKGKAWIECRRGYIQSVHGLCERCQAPGLIVHHKIVLNPANINDPYVSLNWDNLEYLCQTCHNREHHGEEHAVTREGLRFDSNGDIAPL